MHHALEIHEILANIFAHCYPPGTPGATSGLATLARTRRAFKEPALDMLWESLTDLSALVRCLPEASHRSSPADVYSFSRPLSEAEWDVLRSYTRRIRSILQDSEHKLDVASFSILLSPPTAEPLFPNLLHLRCRYLTEAIPLSRLPLPSLTSLELMFGNPLVFHNYVESFPKFSPNLRHVYISVDEVEDMFIKMDPNYFHQWQDLQTVFCDPVALDSGTLVHLSRMPALTRLAFTVDDSFPPGFLLSFSNLRDLILDSESLAQISQLLSLARLPVVTSLIATVDSCHSVQDLSSFLAIVQTSSAAHLVENLWLNQPYGFEINRAIDPPLLGFDSLRPYLAFSNLRSIRINLEWDVHLTDGDVLTLASAWLYLEELSINADWGWNILAGITPDGLVRILQTCPSLVKVALAIDTRGYVQPPPSVESLGLTLPRMLSIDFANSNIEAESILPMASYLASIASSPDFPFRVWDGLGMVVDACDFWGDHKARWDDVYRRANEILSQRS